MTEPDPRAEIEKIEESISQLEKLKADGVMPAVVADASIAALKKEIATYQAKVQGGGAIAQGGAKAAGERAVMNERGIQDAVVNTGDNVEINIGTQPRAKTTSLREAYLNFVLEQVSPLALSGVVRQSQSEAEIRLDLISIYTALCVSSPTPIETLNLTKETIITLQSAAIQDVEDVLRLLNASEKSIIEDIGVNNLDILKEMMPGEYTLQGKKSFSVVWHINKKQKLVILGDPGSGKSTFINFVALCMVGEMLGRVDANLAALTQPLPQEQDERRRKWDEEPQPQPWEHGTLIPVRVILRDFAARGLPPLGEAVSAEHVWAFIETELNAASLGEFAPLLKKELREKGGLVLFDGLDEVPEAEHRREQMRTALENFVAAFPQCRYLVTSRTYAYQKQDWKLRGFQEAVLAPFTEGQVANFVDRWYEHITMLRSRNKEDGKGKAEILKRAILANERLMSLAERPLLLTLMASIHAWRGGTLPDKRQELYADAVDLLLDWWESQRVVRDSKGNVSMIQPSLAEWLKVDRKKVRDLLNQLAYEAHAGQGELTGTADVSEHALITGLMNLSQNPDVKPARLIEYLRDRAGLLIPRGVGVYTFTHRTFQEYLAACHLTDHDYPDLIASLARKEPNRWREVALLAGAKAASGAAVFALWSLVDSLSPERETQTGEAPFWGAQIAGQAVIEIADLEKISASTQPKVDRLRTRLLDIMEGNRLPAIERAQAGNNLAALGDPRFNPDFFHLPAEETLGFIYIPAGKFLMGSDDKDEQASDYEKPQHEVDLPEYWMAKYPVTVGQFRAFVEATNYKFNNWRWNQVSTYPIVLVTWYDALAYSKWLDGELRKKAKEKIQSGEESLFWQRLAAGKLQVTLPSEAEWENAANMGSDRQIYLFGNLFDVEKANVKETINGKPSVVGCFPPCPNGLFDVIGNVWEWTRSILRIRKINTDIVIKEYTYPYKFDDGREDTSFEQKTTHVLRGGSFLDTGKSVHIFRRNGYFSDVQGINFGFRVVILENSQKE